MIMVVIDSLQWWYSTGWAWFARTVLVSNNNSIAQFFSFADLLRTLGAPFRQDATNTQNAPLNVKMQALGFNLISRFFGFIIRSMLIVSGLLIILVSSFFGLLFLILWPLVPLAPFVGIGLFAFGVGG